MIIDWFLFVFLLLVFIYAAYVVKTEKEKVLDISQEIKFHHIIFLIPPWWLTKKINDQEIFFHSTKNSTFNKWQGYLQLVPQNNLVPKSRIEFIDFVNKYKKISLDLDDLYFQQKKENTRTDKYKMNIFQIEGQGLYDNEERLYFKGSFIEFSDTEIYYLESTCPVLHGVVEGPYFDNIIDTINYTKNSNASDNHKSEVYEQ